MGSEQQGVLLCLLKVNTCMVMSPNSQSTPRKSSGCFRPLCTFQHSSVCRYFNKIMQVVGFRAKKSFCLVETPLYVYFLPLSRLVDERPFVPLVYRPHNCVPCCRRVPYLAREMLDTKDCPNSISVTLLVRNLRCFC